MTATIFFPIFWRSRIWRNGQRATGAIWSIDTCSGRRISGISSRRGASGFGCSSMRRRPSCIVSWSCLRSRSSSPRSISPSASRSRSGASLRASLMPIGKALWQVIAGPRLQRNRTRAVATTFGALLAASVILFLAPAPGLHHDRRSGLAAGERHRACRDRRIRAPAAGRARAHASWPARRWSRVKSRRSTPSSTACRRGSPSSRRRLPPSVSPTASRPRSRRPNWGMREPSLRRRPIAPSASSSRSQGEGTFAVMKPQDLPGRFLREGQEIGYVLPPSSRIVRATIHQDDIDLVRNRLRSVRVRLAERLDEILPARIIREVYRPVATTCRARLWAVRAAAPVPVDPRDPQGNEPYNRVFQVDIELPADISATAAFGSRAYVRFDHDWEPVGQQIWRRERPAPPVPAPSLR